MAELQYLLALNSLSDIGPVVGRRLLDTFGTPEQIFRASTRDLLQVEGIGASRARHITSFSQWDRIEGYRERSRALNISIIPFDHRDYPDALKTIPCAPLLIYVRGRITGEDKYAVAMVGSRAATDYGLKVAEGMAARLASCGLTVVSGMASGIDTAAHRGALRAGGRTIAVLGTGPDKAYPAANRGLMESIAESGAVVSEFAPGMPPNKENFPRRNRIISGLALGTVVVEATLDSGSLITVAYALEQGKEVFAVPGNITSGRSRGTNELIRKGARLVQSAEEVIGEISPQLKAHLREDRLREQELPGMTQDENRVYRSLTDEPRHIDRIVRSTEMPVAKTLSLLLTLELKGVVRQGKGKHFSVC